MSRLCLSEEKGEVQVPTLSCHGECKILQTLMAAQVC